MSNENKAVFLSYASQDAEAAKRICDALRAAGVEVWFDQSELRGGDAWDQKIRRQIKECALFVPVISANTQARLEGYFRLEWRIAVERMQHMDDDVPFLLPVVVDHLPDAGARVPERFRERQWTRLSGGETPPAFAERVKKLLGGEVDVGRDLRIPPSGRQAGFGNPALQKWGASKWWWALPIFGMSMALFLALKEPRRDPVPALSSSNGSNAANHPSPSEAQKLVAQARQIYESGDEINRENLFFAEDLLKRALALDPADPEAWELSASLSYTMVWHLIDNSEQRRTTLATQAARAVALAPHSVAAQLAVINARLAMNFNSISIGTSDMEHELLALATREPQSWQVQGALGSTYRFLNRPEESVHALQRAVELSGGHPRAVADLANVLLRRRRYAEADAAITAALPGHPTGRLLTFDTVVKLRWRGDAAAARQSLDAWPAWLRQEDRGVFMAWQTWMWSREPQQALRVVRGMQQDYLRDFNFYGPRAVLSAQAHELAGNTEAARADWQTVLTRVERELAAEPENDAALYWKAWAMARLGQTAEAQPIALRLQQRNQSSLSVFFKGTFLASLLVTVGQNDAALAELKSRISIFDDSFGITRARLELDPDLDPLRADPRFKELVAAAPAPESKNMAESAAPKVDEKSVAVLAFANLSDDKNNEYFSDGISEELLNVLAKVPGLKVTARTSSFHFKGKDTPIPEIAQQLGVAYVVEGSVRKSGDKVRITAQLIKAADGFHVWSDTFTRELKDIFAVQDEIAGLIAQQLQVKLGTSKAAREVNPEAHRLVLEGRHFWGLRTENGFDRAEEAFRRAIELDPEFAPAHAGLALVLGTRLAYTAYLGETVLPGEEQRAEAQRALAIDPAQPEAIAALGQAYFQEGRDAESAEEYRKGLALNPNSALLHHWYSLTLENSGRLDEALAEITRATELDPLSGIALVTRERFLVAAGRYAEALELRDRVVGLLPEVETSFGMEAMSLLKLGRTQEAVDDARKITSRSSLNRRIMVDAHAVHVLRQTGHEKEAAEHAAAIMPRFRPTSYQRGTVLVALGNWEEAVPFLERTPRTVRYLYYWDPTWDTWRDDPRFQQLIKKLGCEAEYRTARETLARMQRERSAAK